MTGLEARGLTLAYDRRGMVEGLTLALPAGRGAVILGPNGCGRSGLLKALAERALRGGQAFRALPAPCAAGARLRSCLLMRRRAGPGSAGGAAAATAAGGAARVRPLGAGEQGRAARLRGRQPVAGMEGAGHDRT